LFTSRLVTLLGERLAASGAGSTGSLNVDSLTPAFVNQLPAGVKATIVGAYNDALTPVYLYIVPLMVVGGILMLFVKEKPLASSNETLLESS
jgi:hypothetical protein